MTFGVPGQHGQLAVPLVAKHRKADLEFATTQSQQLVWALLVIAKCAQLQNVLKVTHFSHFTLHSHMGRTLIYR